MTTNSNQGTEPQFIRMVDQRDRDVALYVRQNGGPPGPVTPGKLARFKIRTNALAYRIDRIFIRECENWHVHDVRVGSQSQFLSVGDSPEQDGIPGAAFSSPSLNFLPFGTAQTVQTGMDLYSTSPIAVPRSRVRLLVACCYARQRMEMAGTTRSKISNKPRSRSRSRTGKIACQWLRMRWRLSPTSLASSIVLRPGSRTRETPSSPRSSTGCSRSPRRDTYRIGICVRTSDR